MPWDKQFDIDSSLEKAMGAFWSRGYEATSIQDLVNCMGIKRGSIYATYGDKRTLFLAALKRYGSKICNERLKELARTCTPLEAIRGLFQFQVDKALCDKGHSGCFVTNTALELAAHDREIGMVVAENQEGLEGFFIRMIETGQAQGEISKAINAQTAARSLLGSLIALLVLARSRPEKDLLQAIADDALNRLK